MIVSSVDVGDQRLTHRHRFSNCVVADRDTFLFQGRFGLGRIVHFRFVITVDLCESCYGNPYHAEFVSESSQLFNVVLHSNKLGTKD